MLPAAGAVRASVAGKLLGVVLDLRREVVAHEAEVLAVAVVGLVVVLLAGRRQAVLDHRGHVVRERDVHARRASRRLRELREVPARRTHHLLNTYLICTHGSPHTPRERTEVSRSS